MSKPASDKVVRVLVVEDDPHARDVMCMLLVRDWRTKVVAEAASLVELKRFLKSRRRERVDLMLIDVEHPHQADWAFELTAAAQAIMPKTLVLFTSTHPNEIALRQALRLTNCQGYILNSEVLYALAGVVWEAAQGRWVTTRGVRALAQKQILTLPPSTLVLDGGQTFNKLSPRQRDVARLALLFNLRHAEIADELNITVGQVNKYVSAVYQILDVPGFLDGSNDAGQSFEAAQLLNRFRDARLKARTVKKAEGEFMAGPEKTTLAFHLLTMPIALTQEDLLD